MTRPIKTDSHIYTKACSMDEPETEANEQNNMYNKLDSNKFEKKL